MIAFSFSCNAGTVLRPGTNCINFAVWDKEITWHIGTWPASLCTVRNPPARYLRSGVHDIQFRWRKSCGPQELEYSPKNAQTTLTKQIFAANFWHLAENRADN